MRACRAGARARHAGRRPERPTIKSRDAHSGGGLRGRLGQSPQRVEYGVDGSYVVDGGDRADLLGARGHRDLGFQTEPAGAVLRILVLAAGTAADAELLWDCEQLPTPCACCRQSLLPRVAADSMGSTCGRCALRSAGERLHETGVLVLQAQDPSALGRPIQHLHFFPDSRVVHQAGARTTAPVSGAGALTRLVACWLHIPTQAIFGMWMVFGIIFGIPGEATLFEHFLWWCVHLFWCVIPQRGSYALMHELCFKLSVSVPSGHLRVSVRVRT